MKYSKLSNYQIKKILQNFCLELTAVQSMGINHHAIVENNILKYLNFYEDKKAA